jgi:uncharacterized repeat protein (TIGR03803 family)
MKRSSFGVLATILFATLVCCPCKSWAQTFTFSTLYSFKSSGTGPNTPVGFLIIDSEDNLYGLSLSGGTYGMGTVFKITSKGKLSVLHSFRGGPTDGEEGQALPAFTQGLAMDKSGNLYGTVPQGGNSTACSNSRGCGVAFKLTPSGTETILYNFAEYSGSSNVILDSEGNLYGTATSNSDSGVVYEIKDGTLSVLYSFCALPGCEDGAFPSSGLVRDSPGNLYGVTSDGGSADEGTVFKLTPSGVETVLHSFLGSSTDGSSPGGNLKQDSAGNLYGTTAFGDPGNGGVLFEQPEDGKEETVLYSFCTLSGCVQSFNPVGPVQIDKSGNFYGVAYGPDDDFVVWEVNSVGEEAILHSFPAGMNSPGAGLVIDSAGNLYGINSGTSTNAGSVFKLTLVK